MQVESPDMAMANLANLAKFDPSNPTFSRFSQKSHSHPAGITFAKPGRTIIPKPLERAALALCDGYGDDQDRITVHVPSLRLASGRAVACDLSVPVNRLPDLEKALGIERQMPAALPPELVHVALAVCKAYGDGEAAQAEMLADLAHYPSTQFPALIAHFRAKLEPVRCVDCSHADIDAGIAQCRAGLESGLPTRGYWYSDPHVCPWHFKSRDSPDAEK